MPDLTWENTEAFLAGFADADDPTRQAVHDKDFEKKLNDELLKLAEKDEAMAGGNCPLAREGRLADKVNRLQDVLVDCVALARDARPKNGFTFSRPQINDAWADGFHMAAIEISDAIQKRINEAEEGES